MPKPLLKKNKQIPEPQRGWPNTSPEGAPFDDIDLHARSAERRLPVLAFP